MFIASVFADIDVVVGDDAGDVVGDDAGDVVGDDAGVDDGPHDPGVFRGPVGLATC